MSSLISISKSSEDLPVAPLLMLTRTAIGFGLGILVANRMKPPLRQATAITLLAIGALAAAPWLVKITIGQITRPESEWGSRARLRSIRGDSGYTSDNDIY
jgi:4-amino-4-deoxy-L-arabinose transferase-like glycosyltransferase